MVFIRNKMEEWTPGFLEKIKEDEELAVRKWEVGKLNKMECEDKGMEVDVMGNDVCELIESLKKQGRILKKLQKELGIEEFEIPIIGGEESWK